MIPHWLKIHKSAANSGSCFLCARDGAVMARLGWPLKPADGFVLGANQAMKAGG